MNPSSGNEPILGNISEKNIEPSDSAITPSGQLVHDTQLPPKSKSGKWPKKVALFLLGQWLVIGIGVACVLAAYFPDVAKHDGIIKSQYTILYGAVAIIFLISGLQISNEKLAKHLSSWRLHLITQIISFLITPVFFLAIVWIIIASKGLENGIDVSMLVGVIALAALPTTIASNVVFTRTAGGDDSAAMIEVMIGNILGPFVTPGLCYLLLPTTDAFQGWSPVQGNSGLEQLYRAVFKQIGLSVLIPLAAGQFIQWMFPIPVKHIVTKYRLGKVNGVCLIFLIWSTFSSCFATGALYEISHATVICNVFLNVGTYFLFTAICFYVSRPPLSTETIDSLNASIQRFLPQRFKKFTLFRKLSKEETIAVCFCGAAKTSALGIPMVDAMWGHSDRLKLDMIQIPVILYTTEQIFFAQALVWFFKRWIDKDKKAPVPDVEAAHSQQRIDM
ncbi:sodium/bile acid cotransporter [Phlyctema vagabunda]|uniref:Sodium/bile acid cotransporter n=1 Tax=Phlyctema vagabunda TaxID=108571 RepID=A0ABR4PUF7_9HELO